MAWLKIDDRVRTHPKIARAGPAAAWLWFCGVCYAREHLTDGFLPKEIVPTLAGGLPSPWKHAAKLVEVHLWEDALGGYRVHDFLDWNPSRSEVLSLRDKERDKKRTQRGTHEGQGQYTSCVGAGGPARDRAGDAGSVSSEASEDLLKTSVPRSRQRDLDVDFDRFWACYPRKVARAAAWAEWKRINPTGALTEAILAGLERAKATRVWREAMREPEMPHVAHARTWLHQRRWTDEVATAPETSPRSVIAPDVRALCNAAGLKIHDIESWFAGATLSRDQRTGSAVLAIPNDDDRAWVQRHFSDVLEAAIIAKGGTKLTIAALFEAA